MGDEVTEAQVENPTGATTEEVEGTGDEELRVQGNEAETPNDDDVDPLEEMKKLWEAEALERVREEALEQARKEKEDNDRLAEAARQAQLRSEQAKNRFAEASKKAADAIKSLKVYDEDGMEVKLGDDVIQQVINPWHEYNQNVAIDKETEVYTNLASAVVANLPETAREEFAKRAANKPLQEYIKIYAELAAPIADIEKRLEAKYEEKIKAAEARGMARAQKAMRGTPPQGNSLPPTPDASKPDLTTLSGAARALANGEITAEKYREIHRKFRG